MFLYKIVKLKNVNIIYHNLLLLSSSNLGDFNVFILLFIILLLRSSFSLLLQLLKLLFSLPPKIGVLLLILLFLLILFLNFLVGFYYLEGYASLLTKLALFRMTLQLLLVLLAYSS